jgi:putative aldouronate transport system permease protein
MREILSLDGIVNQGIQFLGLQPVQFLGEPAIFPWTLIVTDIWKSFGFGTVIYLGGILSAGFDQVFNLYSPIVYTSGDIIDTYLYRLGIEQAQYSVSAAAGLFKSLVSAVLILTSYYLADRIAGYRVL